MVYVNDEFTFLKYIQLLPDGSLIFTNTVFGKSSVATGADVRSSLYRQVSTPDAYVEHFHIIIKLTWLIGDWNKLRPAYIQGLISELHVFNVNWFVLHIILFPQ